MGNSSPTICSCSLKDFNDLKETARYLRISERQLRDLRREGVIPHPTTLLGKPLYTREQLEGIRSKALIQAGFAG